MRRSLRRGIRLARPRGKAQGLSRCLLYHLIVWKPVPGRVPKRLHHVVEQLVIAVDERELIVARVFERSAVQIAESSMDGLEKLPNRQVESTRWRTKTNDVPEVPLDPLLPLFGAARLATRAKENGATFLSAPFPSTSQPFMLKSVSTGGPAAPKAMLACRREMRFNAQTGVSATTGSRQITSSPSRPMVTVDPG